jgi:antitoxin component of MazEF toxin-antitoxin module
MTKKVLARRAGGSLTVALPAALVARLGLAPGQPLWLVEQADGVLLTPYDPQFERTLEEYRRGTAQYREALRALGR